MDISKYISLVFVFFMGATSTYGKTAPELFEGSYHGQGRGCGGVLTVRKKTITWHSQALHCEIKTYEVLEEEHNGYQHRIVYTPKFKNKTCPLFALELNHDENFSSYMIGWQATGFFKKEEYEDRQNPASASYVCALIKDYNSRNNPEPKDLPKT